MQDDGEKSYEEFIEEAVGKVIEEMSGVVKKAVLAMSDEEYKEFYTSHVDAKFWDTYVMITNLMENYNKEEVVNSIVNNIAFNSPQKLIQIFAEIVDKKKPKQEVAPNKR